MHRAGNILTNYMSNRVTAKRDVLHLLNALNVMILIRNTASSTDAMDKHSCHKEDIKREQNELKAVKLKDIDDEELKVLDALMKKIERQRKLLKRLKRFQKKTIHMKQVRDYNFKTESSVNHDNKTRPTMLFC